MSKRKKRLKKMQEVLLDASFISFFYMNIVHIILALKTNTFLILVVTQSSLRRETFVQDSLA